MEEIIEQPIKVYVKTNSNNEIIEVGSSIFIQNLTGWIFIDEGFGDKFAHAQSQYFNKPLINEYGNYRFKLKNGIVIEK